MKKILITLTLTAFVLLTAGAVHAELITQSFTGTITTAVDNNAFGVAVNDSISWSATYDTQAQLTNSNYLVLNQNPNYKLQVTVGNRTFNETEDISYNTPDPFGGPSLMFGSGDIANGITGVSFVVDFKINPNAQNDTVFNLFESEFKIYEKKQNQNPMVVGTLDMTPSAVPVPSAILLLGAGLVGLAGFNRKK